MSRLCPCDYGAPCPLHAPATYNENPHPGRTWRLTVMACGHRVVDYLDAPRDPAGACGDCVSRADSARRRAELDQHLAEWRESDAARKAAEEVSGWEREATR